MAKIIRYSAIKDFTATTCGEKTFTCTQQEDAPAFFTELYHFLALDYKKFYKMDLMSKVGFLASELALKGVWEKETPKQDVSIILFNRSSSLETDTNYQKTIDDPANYFPSPSEFVYTLPNIITGEIAIRNKIYGESSFYVTEDFDAAQVYDTVSEAFTEGITRIVTGWVEYYQGHYRAFIMVVDRESAEGEPFTKENIAKLYNK